MKTKILIIFTMLFVTLACTIPLKAQSCYYLKWDSTYSGPGTGQDSAVALALDNTGDFLYVTGWSISSGTNADIVTIKYNRLNGSMVWLNRYDFIGLVDRPTAIAVDNSSGSVYVTGYSYRIAPSNRDFVTIKYNQVTGDTIWTRRYNGAANGGDESYAMGIDDSGNVFISGNADQGATTADIVTIKYTPAGAETIEVLNLPNFQKPNALKVDDSGYVYIAGITRTGGNTVTNEDYITLKYNNSLTLQWSEVYNGTGNNRDNATALTYDIMGNVYVTGFSYWTGQLYNYVTIKYDADGDSLAAASYDGPIHNSEYATSIAMDNSSNIYVTGYSVQAVSPSMIYDYATVKYNSSLAEQWVNRYDGTGSGNDYAASLALDQSGNVYVTGMSMGNYYDYLTLKYSTSGALLCTLRQNPTGNMNAYAASIAVESDSVFYLTGSALFPQSGLDFYTIRYNLCRLTVDAGENKTIYIGYGEQSATLTAMPGGGNPPYTYLWSTSDTTQSITVSPTVTTHYSVTVTDAENCTSTDTVSVNVIDIRCGNNNHKVYVCHNGLVICVDIHSVPAHLAHGDQLGFCIDSRSNIQLNENPGKYKLHINYPNPFNPETSIKFEIPQSSKVSLKIYDITGREVVTLVDRELKAGFYDVKWNASDYPSGVYFYKLTAGEFTETRKMILVK